MTHTDKLILFILDQWRLQSYGDTERMLMFGMKMAADFEGLDISIIWPVQDPHTIINLELKV